MEKMRKNAIKCDKMRSTSPCPPTARNMAFEVTVSATVMFIATWAGGGGKKRKLDPQKTQRKKTQKNAKKCK